MPHSSGGGSHGGGFHGGGSHGGSSSNRISRTYFPGSRRYLKHHRYGGEDEYIYASSMPRKSGKSTIAVIAVMAAIFTGMTGIGIFSSIPKKLNAHYLDMPAVHDDIGAIKDEDELEDRINEYCDLTGICPVIYTVYDEDWEIDYRNLEDYTYDKYVDNFRDEQHFVIVYSVPYRDMELLNEGKIRVPDYSWEAVQGDETDPFLTESEFRSFGKVVMKALERGYDPGTAFSEAFSLSIKDAESKLDPGSPAGIFQLIGSVLPLLFIAGIFVPILILTIKQYKRDKYVDYVEVPLDDQPQASAGGVSAGFHTETYSGPNYSSRSFSYTPSESAPMPKGVKIFSLLFFIPFVIAGIVMIATAAGMLAAGGDGSFGVMLLIFGLVWTTIITVTIINFFVKNFKKTKAAETPLTAEYPKAEYPQAEYPAAQMPVQNSSPVSPASGNTEFDPRFFDTSKSDYDSDDEDYRRMKRKGYE